MSCLACSMRQDHCVDKEVASSLHAWLFVLCVKTIVLIKRLLDPCMLGLLYASKAW